MRLWRSLAVVVVVSGLSALTVTAPAGAITSTVPKPLTLRVTVRDYRPVGGIKRFTVKKGRKIVLVVTSNKSEEIHLHGYDLARDVAPGKPARIAFTAKIAGRFARGHPAGRLSSSDNRSPQERPRTSSPLLAAVLNPLLVSAEPATRDVR